MYTRAIAEGFPAHQVVVLIRNDCPGADDPLRSLPNVVFHSAALWRGPLRALGFALQGLKLALSARPVCIVSTHLHFLPVMRLARALTGARILSVLHGIDVWHLRGRLRRRSLRAADHLMAVSRHTRDITLRDFDLPPDRISVVPNTFDEDRFTPGPKPAKLMERHGLEPGQQVLLTVGRLLPAEQLKGHRQVLFALRLLRERYPGLRYLIGGTGPDAEGLREAVASLGLEDAVIFAGQIAPSELADYYRLADVFVMPSIKEGFGIVFLEAMACGKPVIAGCRDGSVDALDGGRLGVLVDPFMAADLAEKIDALLSDRHDNALPRHPDALHSAVTEHYGHHRVAQIMTAALQPWVEGERNQPAAPASLATAEVRPAATDAFRVVVVTQFTSPYQIEFFNAVARQGRCFLEVVYATDKDASRSWERLPMAHVRWILSEGNTPRREALKSIRDADLVVFNTYLDRFVLKSLHERARLRRPWVFWGERPGSLRTGWAGRWLRRLLLRPLHEQDVPIWGMGRFGVEGYQREYGSRRRYQRLSYASDLRRFAILPDRDPAARVFLYSGSLTQRKGADLLASAFARLAARHPAARLVIAGEGPLESSMRAALSPCANQVEWLGFKSWRQLPEAFAKGAIICLPSRYDGWGLALVEGMAAGMAAIGSDQTGSALELLADGAAGWLVKANDALALEQAMESALRLDDAAFAGMRKAAKITALEFGLEASVPRFLQACREALSSSCWRASLS